MWDPSNGVGRRDVLRAAVAAAAGLALSSIPGAMAFADDAGPAPAGARKKVLYFTKSSGFQHDMVKRKGDQLAPSEQILTELGAAHGFDVAATKDGAVFTPENLAGYDAIMFYTTGDLTTLGTDKQPPMTHEGKQALLDAIAGGKGFVGVHSATDTFHSKNYKHDGELIHPGDLKEPPVVDPYIAMIGGEFISHGAQQESKMRVADPNFPGLADLKDFTKHEEWYALEYFQPDLHVILVQGTEEMKGKMYQRAPYPSTWARPHGKGRVFYTSMGHREDVWRSAEYHAVLLAGIAWATGAVKADIPPNLKEAAPEAVALPAAIK